MLRRDLLRTLAAVPLAPSILPRAQAPADAAPAQHVIAISLDGVRWQEIFGGLDAEILQSAIGKTKKEDHPIYKQFWRETREARREALMPFFWGTFLKEHGSIVGDQLAGSVMRLGNRMRFSYPGYAELMTGAPHDDAVTSNDNRRYPFETVLQFLRRDLGVPYEKVACFGSWNVFQTIPASRDGDVYTNAGYQAYEPDATMARLSRTQFEATPPWDNARLDTFTWQFALDHLWRHEPRALWIGMDDSDDWQHQRNYVRLLQVLHRFDGWLKELWEALQAKPAFAGRTALAIVTDHGRGSTTTDWNSHGQDVEGAQNVWAAFAAPHWKTRGIWRSGHAPASQSQIAATVASFLGRDFRKAVPNAGAPLVPPS